MQRLVVVVCVLLGIASANAGLLSGVTSTLGNTVSTVGNTAGNTVSTVGNTVGNLLGGTSATPTTPTKTGTGSAAAE